MTTNLHVTCLNYLIDWASLETWQLKAQKIHTNAN